jgi:hypothetical protein
VCNCTGNPSCGKGGTAVVEEVSTETGAAAVPFSDVQPSGTTVRRNSAPIGGIKGIKGIKGCPPLWPCNYTVKVRELLSLGPAYYFQLPPKGAVEAPTKYDRMWPLLFDSTKGFWGEFGPTTVERGHRCFNQTQDQAECNWAGPSWPYETSRVLTGLANYLVDYPAGNR